MIESYDEFFAAVNRVAKGHTGDEKCSALGQRENREKTNITLFFGGGQAAQHVGS